MEVEEEQEVLLDNFVSSSPPFIENPTPFQQTPSMIPVSSPNSFPSFTGDHVAPPPYAYFPFSPTATPIIMSNNTPRAWNEQGQVIQFVQHPVGGGLVMMPLSANNNNPYYPPFFTCPMPPPSSPMVTTLSSQKFALQKDEDGQELQEIHLGDEDEEKGQNITDEGEPSSETAGSDEVETKNPRMTKGDALKGALIWSGGGLKILVITLFFTFIVPILDGPLFYTFILLSLVFFIFGVLTLLKGCSNDDKEYKPMW